MPTYEVVLTLVVKTEDEKEAERIADKICDMWLPPEIDDKIQRFSSGDPEEIPEEEE